MFYPVPTHNTKAYTIFGNNYVSLSFAMKATNRSNSFIKRWIEEKVVQSAEINGREFINEASLIWLRLETYKNIELYHVRDLVVDIPEMHSYCLSEDSLLSIINQQKKVEVERRYYTQAMFREFCPVPDVNFKPRFIVTENFIIEFMANDGMSVSRDHAQLYLNNKRGDGLAIGYMLSFPSWEEATKKFLENDIEAAKAFLEAEKDYQEVELKLLKGGGRKGYSWTQKKACS